MIAGEYALTIERGAHFGPRQFTFRRTVTGLGIDMSAYTLLAPYSRSYGGARVGVIGTSWVDASTGVGQLEDPASITAAIPEAIAGRGYVWNLLAVRISDGEIFGPYLRGTLTISGVVL